MVKSEELNVGDHIRRIDNIHVHGTIERLGVLGKKNFFKLKLSSGQYIVVQKPDEWEYVSSFARQTSNRL